MAFIMDSSRADDRGAYRAMRLEHAFYRMFSDHNAEALRDPGLVDAPGRGTVTLSRMAYLRDRAVSRVIGRVSHEDASVRAAATTFGSSSSEAVRAALSGHADRSAEFFDALADAVDEGGDFGDRAAPRSDSALFSDARHEFNRVLGVTTDATSEDGGVPAASRLANNTTILRGVSHGALVSPIDPMWRGRYAMSFAGAHEALAAADSMLDDGTQDGTPNLSDIGSTGSSEGRLMRLTQWPIDLESGTGGVPVPKTLGPRNAQGARVPNADGSVGAPAWSFADASGLSLLRPFSDERSFAGIVARCQDQWSRATPRQMSDMRRATSDMREILDTLVAEGHSVALRGGWRDGTVEAIVDGGDVEVRAFDNPGQSRWLGRSYAHGATWRLAEPRKAGPRSSEAVRTRSAADLDALESDLTLGKREALVRLALGESPDNVRAAAGSATYTDTAPRMVIGSLGDGPGEVMCEWKPQSKYRGYDEERPMERVTELVRSARANLAEEVDLDGLSSGSPRATQDQAVMREREALERVADGGGDARQALEDWLDDTIGSESGAAHGDLDVDMCAKWADGSGQFECARVIRSAIEREARLAQTDPEHHQVPQGRGAGALVGHSFDPNSARHIGDESVGPVQERAMEAVRDTLSTRGVHVSDVAVDGMGVIRWEGAKTVRNKGDVAVSGVVGQVFEPEPSGEVRCELDGGERLAIRRDGQQAPSRTADDFVLEPAWRATIVPTRVEPEHKAEGVYQRMRLTNDVDDVIRAVTRQVAQDVCQVGGGEATGDGAFFAELGQPTSVNSAWRHAAGARHDPETMDRRFSADEGQHIDERFDQLRLDAERRRVRMDGPTHANSTTYAIITHVEDPDADPMDLADDVTPKPVLKALSLTGLTDMSSMSNPQAAGVFDPAITAQGRDQGLNKTLVEGAHVVDGRIQASPDPHDRAPIMKDEAFSECDHDTWLRQQLAAANSMAALEITEPVQVAHVACGGFEQDDAMVVSKAFAERYGVVPTDDPDAEWRPLTTNDKLSDMHGNKGLVSLVVDPDMSDEEADARGIRAQRDLFRANPDLSVVMSPFSFISRGNAGTAREGMEAPHDLRLPVYDDDGNMSLKTVDGGSCELRMMVQTHTVDEKSTIYDDQGSDRGRLVGWQLSAGLSAIGAKGLLAEMFDGNEAGLARIREDMRCMGYDLDDRGHVRDHLVDDGRPTIELPRDERSYEAYVNKQGQVKYRTTDTQHQMFSVADSAEARRTLDRKGGVARIAMPMSFSTKQPDGSWEPDRTMPEDANGEHMMPVMGAYDRTGSDFVDAGSAVHDHTSDYVTIMQNDARWRLCREAAATARDPRPFEHEMDRLVTESDHIYAGIEREVDARELEAHDNVFKKAGLGVRVGHSATLPWSPDPRLDIQQLAMGPEEAERLGVSDGDPVVLWRDPVLTTSCVRSFEAKVEDGVRGLQVNPVVAGTIGGDFDGDTVGVYVPQTEAGRADCEGALSFASNLVDANKPVPVDPSDPSKGYRYELGVGLGLDVGLATADDTGLARELEDIRDAISDDIEGRSQLFDAATGDTPATVLESLNDIVHEAQGESFGKGCLRYGSPEDNVRSIWEACVQTGVKGSAAKLEGDYCRNLGVTVDGGLTRPDGSFNDGCIHDVGHTLLTDRQNEATQFATHAKAAYTGLSGYAMQIALEAASTDEEVRAATTLTEQIYQHTLDYKTNDRAAREETPAISKLSDTLRGIPYEMPIRYKDDVHGGKRPVFERDASVKRGGMDPARFEEQYRHISHVFGIDPNPRALDTVANMPTMRSTDFLFRGIGGSPMHTLAFEPRRVSEHLDVYAQRGTGLYDGSISRDVEPHSIRQAKGDPMFNLSRLEPPTPSGSPTVSPDGIDYAAASGTQPEPERQAQAEAQAAERDGGRQEPAPDDTCSEATHAHDRLADAPEPTAASDQYDDQLGQ